MPIDLKLDSDRNAAQQAVWAQQRAEREAVEAREQDEVKARLVTAGVTRMRWATYWENDEDQVDSLVAFKADGAEAEFNPGTIWVNGGPGHPGHEEIVSIDNPHYTPVTYHEAENLAWHLQRTVGNGAWEFNFDTNRLRRAGTVHEPTDAWVEWRHDGRTA